MILSVLIFSFLLQNIFSNFVPVTHSFFYPLFAISALIIIFPYFKDNNHYLETCFIYGAFYDILCSHVLLLNTFLFLLLGVIILLLNRQWSNNILNNILFQIIIIFIYETISYFILSVIEEIAWNSVLNFKLVGHSLIANILYIALLYFITDKISKKYKIDKID